MKQSSVLTIIGVLITVTVFNIYHFEQPDTNKKYSNDLIRSYIKKMYIRKMEKMGLQKKYLRDQVTLVIKDAVNLVLGMENFYQILVI